MLDQLAREMQNHINLTFSYLAKVADIDMSNPDVRKLGDAHGTMVRITTGKDAHGVAAAALTALVEAIDETADRTGESPREVVERWHSSFLHKHNRAIENARNIIFG